MRGVRDLGMFEATTTKGRALITGPWGLMHHFRMVFVQRFKMGFLRAFYGKDEEQGRGKRHREAVERPQGGYTPPGYLLQLLPVSP